MKTVSRRYALKQMGGSVTLVALGTALMPSQVLAEWPKTAFEAETLDDALKALFDGESTEPSDKITMKAPDIAENGAVVPVSAAVDMENVEAIYFLASENPSPLAASFDLTEGLVPDVSTRLKMGKTSMLLCIVKAGGKLYSTEKEVKVTIGGCGG